MYLKETLRDLVNRNPLLWDIKHRVYNPLTHWIDRAGGEPRWVRCPQDIQIDTHNYCSCTHEPDENGNLIHKYAGCCFCNVKAGGAYKIPRGRMPDDMLRYIIDYWADRRNLGVEYICPYMNGDPIIDDRLPWINEYSQRRGLKVAVDTSGNVYENRKWLVHPNLTLLRFSISAATSETYEKVQGCPKFKEALDTFRWVAEHKYSSQQLELHFMVCKYNEHEIEDYIRLFKGYKIKLFPLHEMEGIQHASTASLPENPEWINVQDSLEAWKATRPIFIYPNGRRERRVMSKDRTCQGMAYAVQWDGLILHCTDAPPKYNYGHVYETDMLEAWHMRNRARLTNPACRACNAKRPDWEEVIRRYVLKEEK
jgi:MoaA/NifB/PqqE/SkfB family radical SAM enzyme